MAKFRTTKKGFMVIEMSLPECIGAFHGLGICDKCNATAFNGYYVPVLNWYLCPKCYKEFYRRTPYYPEDAEFEKSQATQTIRAIKAAGFEVTGLKP